MALYHSGKDLVAYLKAHPTVMDALPLERFGFKRACSSVSPALGVSTEFSLALVGADDWVIISCHRRMLGHPYVPSSNDHRRLTRPVVLPGSGGGVLGGPRASRLLLYGRWRSSAKEYPGSNP